MIKFKVWDTRDEVMYQPNEAEKENMALGSNGQVVVLDPEMAAQGHLCLTDWRIPIFSAGKMDINEQEMFQGDIVKFTLDPVLADTVSGGSETMCFFISNVGLDLKFENAQFTYEMDILDSPAVLSVEVIGNVWEYPTLADDFEELADMFDAEDEAENWLAGRVRCDLCSHEWVATYHIDSEKLECPNCSNMAHFEDLTNSQTEEDL
jgi:hypothetical protein